MSITFEMPLNADDLIDGISEEALDPSAPSDPDMDLCAHCGTLFTNDQHVWVGWHITDAGGPEYGPAYSSDCVGIFCSEACALAAKAEREKAVQG